MKAYKYHLIAVLFLLAGSCRKSDEFHYSDVPRIQFGPTPNLIYSASSAFNDSMKRHTFVYLESSKLIDTAYFDIYTMGFPSDKDRSFVLKQETVEGEMNAVPGVHYKGFSDPDLAGLYEIKAGQVHASVPVVLLRDPSLREQSVVLKFRVVANENFQTGQEPLLWRKLIFSDRLSRPAAWTDFYSTTYFGKYSEAKHRFFIEVTGQKWDQDFISMIISDTQQLQYWLGIAKSALVAYNKANPNNPKVDEEGDLLLIP